MSIADKRTCSVAKESLDHTDVKAHLQAHVKYAGRKIKDQKNRRAHISTLPVSNDDIESRTPCKLGHGKKQFSLGQKNLLEARTLPQSFLLDTETRC
jgi:hypothetical protein